MSGERPQMPFGRGGRGARLLEALKNQPRLPGESRPAFPTVSEDAKTELSRTLGRGAQLQNILGRGRSLQVSSEAESSVSHATVPTGEPANIGRGHATFGSASVPLGRGQLAAQISGKPLPTLGRGQASALISSPPSVIGRGQTQSALISSPPSVIGRGQALATSSIVGRGHPVSSATTVPTPKFPNGAATVLGRGRGTVLSPTTTTVPDVTQPQKEPVSIEEYEPPVSIAEYEPPEKELESLTIGQYKGVSGKPLNLEVNYVRLKACEGQGIYEYHVSFCPAVDSVRMKYRLMAQPQVKEVIGNVKSFDGAKLYLPIRVGDPEVVINVNLPTDNSPVEIVIKFVKPSRASDLLHLYNLLFRKIMTILKMTQVGRNYYDSKAGIPVPKHSLEVWPGYVTAVQEYEDGVMLNCDASFRVLRTVTARDVMTQAGSRRDRLKEETANQLLGAVVLTRYNNKTYRVDDIEWNKNPRSTFTTYGGKEMSFVDYYKRSYDIDITDLDQPLLVNRPKKKEGEIAEKLLCLIPELCYMTGLTDQMRSDFRVMKDVASHTRVSPNQRKGCLQQFIQNIKSSEEATKVLKDWNLQLDSAIVALPGRGLYPEKISLGKTTFTVSREADWKRQVGQAEVLVPVNFENWVIVYTNKDGPKVRDYVTMMKKVCPSLGIRINDPIRVEIRNDRTETFCSALKDNVNPRIQFVVIIFPSPRDDRYSAVKKLCCVDMPVPSQVINARTISQYDKLRSITQKIALQINCKLGGELWSVPIPMKNVMVCGLDSYHDASNKNRSILAFVSSINQNLTRWFSMTSPQKQGQELGDALRMLFLAALRKYHQVNHRLPEKIFIYRDGVGDGMLKVVKQHEVEQLLSCFRDVQANYSPCLSVIVVQKRINTRIFNSVNGNMENPPPGTVLDHTVTRKGMHDFFIVSQYVNQGTVSPTHFIVVHDTSTLEPEHMQRLAYKMTHLYYNWPGTVRVPAPCLYAHKLAYLVGQNLHKEAHADLSDRLFYL